jgi:uncharacterized membrane protein
MPHEWQPPEPGRQRLHLWPHRSLNQTGFVWFIGLTTLLIAMPALAVLGNPVLWGLLPFLALAVAGIWFALRKNARDREITEILTLTPDQITLVRHGPRGQRQAWQANPHWVRVECHATGGPVPNYLTLRGGPREVEIGAFLAEEERLALNRELSGKLADLRSHAPVDLSSPDP